MNSSVSSSEAAVSMSDMNRGVWTLFFTQMFSTLSFSVVSSSMVLYSTITLGFGLKVALGITATFTAFNFVLHLLGGYIGGRWLSYRSLFCIGMMLLMVGCFIISYPSEGSFYWGLAFFLTGSGLNVTCINCMLTQLFSAEDKRRERAFLWNYSSMNIGFFVGFSMSGYFHLLGLYNTLFLLSASGNLIALIIVLFNWRVLGDRQTPRLQRNTKQRARQALLATAAIVYLIPNLHWLLKHEGFSNQLVLFAGALMAIVIGVLALMQPTKEAQRKLWAFLILGCGALVYFVLYQMMPMGLTLFIEHNVTQHFWGIPVTPQWAQNINPFVIVIGGPVLTIWFARLRNQGYNISIPLQFSLALLLVGTGFGLLPIGIKMADAAGYSYFGWVAMCYVFQAMGEMFITPIGYAMIGQLVPVRLQGILMGSWMMITGVAAPISSYVSKMAAGPTEAINPLITNPYYSNAFVIISVSALLAGLLMLIFTPRILRLMGERRSTTESTEGEAVLSH